MTEFFVGLDLGQRQDFTALCIVGLDDRYLRSIQAADAAYTRLEAARKDPHLDEIDLRTIEHEISDSETTIPDPVYQVRHLEGLPLGTPYTEVTRRVKRLVNTPPLEGNAELAVDATGVGVTVTDQLYDTGLSFYKVTITSGEREHREGGYNRVPKKNLISRAQVLLEEGNRRLKIAPTLPEANTLVKELLNYRYRITPSGNDTYNPWREGQHDDLVLALCLALWAAERTPMGLIDETLAFSWDLFDLYGEDLAF